MKNTKDRFPLDPKVNWWRLPEEVAELAKKVNGKSYKVFTALLSQNGPSNTGILLSQNSPNLVVGVTYQIQDYGGSGWDFTNVGAPNNDLFTSFIATGTVPNSWGTDGQLAYNTGAPIVAVVLENTIGNVWFEYENIGRYAMKSDGLLPFEKTAIFNSTFYSFNAEGVVTLSTPSWEANDDNKVTLTTSVVGNGPLSLLDSLMTTPVLLEVRVYN